MNLNSVTPAVGESDKINAFCKSNSIINLIDSGLMYIGGGGSACMLCLNCYAHVRNSFSKYSYIFLIFLVPA